MTTILYVKDDGIYTDSKFVNVIGDENHFRIHYESKVKCNEDKTIVYAYTGTLKSHNRTLNEKVFHKWLSKYSKIGLSAIMPEKLPWYNKSIKSSLIDTGFLGCKGNIWYLNSKCGGINLSMDDTIDYMGLGSGGRFAEAHLRLNGDPMKAMEFAIIMDELSGGEINYIPFSDLNTFVESDEKEEE